MIDSIVAAFTFAALAVYFVVLAVVAVVAALLSPFIRAGVLLWRLVSLVLGLGGR